MDPITILAGLLPILVEGGKAAVDRWLAPDVYKPTNVADYVAMQNADTDRFKILNDVGTGTTYQWVEAITRLMRPTATVLVLGTWAYLHFGVSVPVDTTGVDNFAGAVGFYLFGDRTLFYAKKR